jgi:hypothetical protein
MIALHVVRSGMYRPLREYIDLLWYVDGMAEDQWQAVVTRARHHHLLPALFLSLRQAVFCLALDSLDPERAAALNQRIEIVGQDIGALRRHAIDRLAPPDYPLRPIASRNRPAFRRSLILGTGTSSMWRVAVAFILYGASRLVDPLSGREALYVNADFTLHFEGWSVEDSTPLLDYLYAHVTRDEFTSRFQWRDGSIAFWDNRATWHSAQNDYQGERRLMHRITVAGCALQAATAARA